ncbi:MAG: hypothetical protein PVS3B3_37140 [Ktedonobacteraceae bacterium]
MLWTIVISLLLIAGGVGMFYMNLRGTHLIWEVFGIIPIPTSYWLPVLLVIIGGFVLFVAVAGH